MSEPVVSPNGHPPESAPSQDAAKLPPFVQVVKSAEGCQVNHNLIDPWLAIALLEMGKQTLIQNMQAKPKLVVPPTGMNGFLHKMGRG